MGLNTEVTRAWVKVDGGKFNEVLDLGTEGMFETAEQAQRAMFKLQLAGEFNK